jgi:hypothetical protein
MLFIYKLFSRLMDDDILIDLKMASVLLLLILMVDTCMSQSLLIHDCNNSINT